MYIHIQYDILKILSLLRLNLIYPLECVPPGVQLTLYEFLSLNFQYRNKIIYNSNVSKFDGTALIFPGQSVSVGGKRAARPGFMWRNN